MSSENGIIIVTCPKHGQHEYAITSDIPGHEGAWCQICWLESLGESLPYRKFTLKPEHRAEVARQIDEEFEKQFQVMEEMIPVPEVGWIPMPKG